MTDPEALDAVVARTGHERFRWLTSESNPDEAARAGYRAHVRALAAGPWPPATTAAPVPHAGPCAHLGPPVLDPDGRQATRPCPTCRGVVRLKLFACRHPGHAADPTTTERQCRECGDWAAPPPP